MKSGFIASLLVSSLCWPCIASMMYTCGSVDSRPKDREMRSHREEGHWYCSVCKKLFSVQISVWHVGRIIGIKSVEVALWKVDFIQTSTSPCYLKQYRTVGSEIRFRIPLVSVIIFQLPKFRKRRNAVNRYGLRDVWIWSFRSKKRNVRPWIHIFLRWSDWCFAANWWK